MTCLPFFAQAESQLGGGVHYWRAAEDVDVDNIDEDGLSWLITYQADLNNVLTLELDLELFPDDFAGLDDSVLAPQAYLLVGRGLYAGVGIGTYYTDGSFEESFYNLRLGLDIEILTTLSIDLNLNYQFMDWSELNDELENVDTDTVTIGAAIRVTL
jgi:hypothetical protein